MQLHEITQALDKKFKKETITDEWAFQRQLFPKEYTGNPVGLVLDFSKEIKKIYTTCFPSKYVLNEILKKKEENCLIISHHPLDWDPPHSEMAFLPWDVSQIELMKEIFHSMQRISCGTVLLILKV